MSVIRVKVQIDDTGIEDYIRSIIEDEKARLEMHNSLARYCSDFLPMSEGDLMRNIEVTPEHLRYNAPYAHYQYVGELYLAENGSSWARAGEKKHPSGRPLVLSKERHPLASKKWDKAMLANRGDAFAEEIKTILVRRAKEMYG